MCVTRYGIFWHENRFHLFPIVLQCINVSIPVTSLATFKVTFCTEKYIGIFWHEFISIYFHFIYIMEI
jgi:hypothetical protein